MKNKAIHILLVLLFLSLMGYATVFDARAAEAATGAAARITDINIADNAVEVNISGDFTYSAYKPSDPFTVAVDLPGVDKGEYAGKLSSTKAGISEVTVSGTGAPNASSKLEILLVSPSEIEAVKSDDSLVIKVKDEEDRATGSTMMAQAGIAGQAEMAVAQMRAQSSMSSATSITGVDFDYSDGTLKLVIQGDGAMTPDVYALDGKIIVDVPNVSMRAELPAAVVAPVKSIRYGPHDGAVRMVIDLQKVVEFTASTVEDKILITLPAEEVLEILTPEAAPEEAAVPGAAPAMAAGAAQAGEYTGKIISLDFQNADIVPIFRFIGDISGYNVVIHPTVSGTVTLKLMNVPWDQALDIILNIYSLEKKIEGNIMTIAPSSVFDKIAKEKAQRRKTDEVTAELVSRTMLLNHIDPEEMKKKIEEEKLLSPRGIIIVDSIASRIKVTDTEEIIQKVAELARDYDRAIYGSQQVLVEAKIVTITASYTRSIGIEWSGTFGLSMMRTPVTGQFSVNQPQGGNVRATVPSPLAGGVISGSAPYSTINLALSALEDIGDSKTLSNPRVLTLCPIPGSPCEAATIQSGTQIPVSTTTAEGSTTEFINANLSLNVTPEIKPNDMIEIEVSVNKDEPVAVGGETGIDTNSVQTKARVKNGETLVIGGIYENTKTNPKSGIPGLRKIPILGWLFGKEEFSDGTDELLILITPRIVK
jgi:type IV pilus assembly protein PilQ